MRFHREKAAVLLKAAAFLVHVRATLGGGLYKKSSVNAALDYGIGQFIPTKNPPACREIFNFIKQVIFPLGQGKLAANIPVNTFQRPG